MEIHLACIDWKCDISHGELMFLIESNEDGKAMMDVGLINVHLP